MNNVLTVADLKKGLQEFLDTPRKENVTQGYWSCLVISIGGVASVFFARTLVSQAVSKPLFAMLSKAEQKAQIWSCCIIAPVLGIAAAALLAVILRIETLLQKIFLSSHRNFLRELNTSDQAVDKATLRQACALNTDLEFKNFLLKQMDFEQLKEARAVFGSKQFMQLINVDFPQSPYTQIWKTIETLSAITNVDAIVPHINTLKNFSGRPWYLPMVKELDQVFRNKPIYHTILPHLLTLSTSIEEIALSFQLPGCAPLIVKREVLEKIGDVPIQLFGFGNRKWEELGREATVPQEVIGSVEDYETFKRIIARYQGLTYSFRLDQFLRDAAFADKYFSLDGVEQGFDEESVAPTLENYEKLGEFYCKNFVSGSRFQKQIMDKLVTLFKASPHTHEEKITFATKYGLENRLIPSKEVLLVRFEEETTDEVLFDLYEVCSAEELLELLQGARDKLCTLPRIKSLLAFFYAKKEVARGQACHQFFANYVKTLSRDEMVQIWGVNQIPPGVEVQRL